MGKNDEQLPMILKSAVYVAERLGVPILAFTACIWFLDRRATAQDQVQKEGMAAIVNALHELSNKQQTDHEALKRAIEAASSNLRQF